MYFRHFVGPRAATTMTRVQVAIYVVLAIALAISVVTDLRTRQIKDVVTYPTLLLCLGLRAAGGGLGSLAGPGLASGLLAVAVGGFFFYVPYLLGYMGKGDVKLMAAVGAGIGFPMVVPVLVFISLSGGILAVVVLLWRGVLWRTLSGMGLAAARKLKLVRPEQPGSPGIKVPYGLAIAGGTVWGVIWTLTQAPVGPGMP